MSREVLLWNVKVAVRRPLDGVWWEQRVHNLLTNAGKDFLHTQCYGKTGLGNNGANYIAVSENSTAPAVGDTSLTGEIVVADLARVQGSISHESSSNVSTIATIFSASNAYPAVQKAGLLTAASGGTLVREVSFTAVSLVSGDQLAVTFTVNLS